MEDQNTTIKDTLYAHIAESNIFKAHMGDDIKEIKNSLDTIQNNHLAHIEPDLAWIVWILKWLLTGIGTVTAGIILALLTKHI